MNGVETETGFNWDDDLYQLLDRWEEAQEHGSGTTPEEFFADETIVQKNPQLREELERCIADVQRFDEFDHKTSENNPAIPGFEIVSEIGRGGMGVVYRAREEQLDRTVAIKVMSSGKFADDAEKMRFMREAKMVARIQHPNVVQLHAYGDADPISYLVMEFMDGGSLAEKWPVSRPAPKEVADTLLELANGMDRSHQENVVHRDLKPSNILLSDDGVPKIADFGLARDIQGSTHTAQGAAVGTPGYMAPEQVDGVGDGHSDIYGLGGILYFGLTGHPPIPFKTIVEFMVKVKQQDPISPRLLAPDTDADLETICLKCLEKKPSHRYQTAKDLADDLRRYLQDEPISARPRSRSEKLIRWCRRQPWRAAAVLLFCLLLAGSSVAAVLFAQTTVTERGLRLEAESQKQVAQRNARLAKTRQTRFQQSNARLLLENRRLSEAKNMIDLVPLELASFDTKLLGIEASQIPQLGWRLADGHYDFLDAVQNPDGSMLVSADASGRLLVWDLKTGTMTRELMRGRWSEESRQFRHHFIRVTEDGKLVDGNPIEWGPCIVDLEWVGNSSRCVGVSLDGSAYLIDLKNADANPNPILETNTSLNAVAVSNDGGTMLVGDAKGNVRLHTFGDGDRQSKVQKFDSAVSQIVFLKSGDWVVGFENGAVRLLEGKSLDVASETRLSGPIWSLDSRNDLVAVGCQSPRLIVFQIGDDQSIQFLDALSMPSVPQTPNGVHIVKFVAKDRILAGDDLGHLLSWDRGSQKVEWSMTAFTRHHNREAVFRWVDDQRKQGSPLSIPFNFRRRVAALSIHQPTKQIIGAGVDATIKFWTDSRGTKDVMSAITQQVGLEPRLVFDRKRKRVLWALDESGKLWAIDTVDDKVLDQVQAHERADKVLAAADLTVTKAGSVISVGADRNAKVWSLNPAGKIQSIKQQAEDLPLLSVAISPDDRLLATVDVEANISIREFDSGKRIHFSRLPGSEVGRPVTGRVAFNLDGSRIAAFGPGQSGVLFKTNPVRQMSDQFWVAGDGGIALAWSPVSPDVVLSSDATQRLHVEVLTPEMRDTMQRMNYPEAACVAIDSTPDRRRVVLLERNGRIIFHDAEHMVEMMIMRDPRGNGCDLAFSGDGACMAVATQNGEIAIWEVDSTAEAEEEVVDARLYQWKRHAVIEPSGEVPNCNERCFGIDPQGRPCLLFVSSIPNDVRGEGAVHFARWENDRTLREPIIVDGTAVDRCCPPSSLSLVFQSNGEPLAAFRRRHATQSPYDCSVHLASRIGNRKWNVETILPSGNVGEYPIVILDKEKQVEAIYHFASGGFVLLRSIPQPDENGFWMTELLGRQGDGMQLNGVAGSDGRSHFIFDPNRFNSDPSPKIYMQFGGGEPIREPISATGASRQIDVLSSGEPVVHREVLRPVGQKNNREFVKRGPDGWTKIIDIPQELHLGPFAVGNDDTLFMTQRDKQGGLWLSRLDLNETREGVSPWRQELVTQFDGSMPTWWSIKIDPISGLPVIAVGRLREANGWIDFYSATAAN